MDTRQLTVAHQSVAGEATCSELNRLWLRATEAAYVLSAHGSNRGGAAEVTSLGICELEIHIDNSEVVSLVPRWSCVETRKSRLVPYLSSGFSQAVSGMLRPIFGLCTFKSREVPEAR